jgi:CheY-like chemotaxis protein
MWRWPTDVGKLETMAGDDHQVLLVEDDEGVRETIIDALTDEGYQVLSAVNGREALKVLEKQRPCMIFLDLMMPIVDGWEVFRRLKADANLATIPVCIMTAVPHKAPLGAVSVLPKPIGLRSMLDLLSVHC